MADKDAKCCEGSVASGSPVGTITKILGVDVYVTSGADKSSSRAVLFLTDAFGIPFVNSRLLADYYAREANLTVYIPDLFDGEPVPEEILLNPELRKTYDFSTFMSRNSKEIRYPRIVSIAKELKQNHGVKKLAAIGFCYGGWGTAKLAGDQLVDGAAFAHPSRIEFPADIENIKTPTLFLMAETDEQFPPKIHEETKAILAKKPFPFTFNFYPKVSHGFAVRGNSDDPVVKQAAEDAAKAAVNFFNTVL